MSKNNCLTEEKLERIQGRLELLRSSDLVLFEVHHREPKSDGDPGGGSIAGAWHSLQMKLQYKWGVSAFVMSAQRAESGQTFALGLVVSPKLAEALRSAPVKTKALLQPMADGSWLAPITSVLVLGAKVKLGDVLGQMTRYTLCAPARCSCTVRKLSWSSIYFGKRAVEELVRNNSNGNAAKTTKSKPPRKALEK